MAQDIGALVVTLEAQTAAFEKGMQSATRELQKFGGASKAVENQFTGIQGAFFKFNNSLMALRGAASVVQGVVMAFAGFAKAREDMLVMESSFKSLMGSAEDAADMVARIVNVAKEIGIKVPIAADAIRRLSLGMTQMGYSNAEIEKVASTFLKIGAVTSSVEEAAGAVFQFAQAMGSGTLRGDELTSLLERQPAIAREIALYMKEAGLATEGTVGELRKMGSQGKITSQIMAEALIAASKKINKQFEDMPVKMSQVTNRMAISWNQFQIAISEKFLLNEKLAASLSILQKTFDQFLRNVVYGFDIIADNIEVVAVAAGVLAVVIGVKLAAAFGVAATAARVFALATGWGAILVGIGAVILYMDKIIIKFQEAGIWLTELAITWGNFVGADTSGFEKKLDELNSKLKETKEELAGGTEKLVGSAGERQKLEQQIKWQKEFNEKLAKSVEEAGQLNWKMARLKELISTTNDPKALQIYRAELKQLTDQANAAAGGVAKWLSSITDQEVGGTLVSVTAQLTAVNAKIKATADPVQLEALLQAREAVLKKYDIAKFGKGGAEVEDYTRRLKESARTQQESIDRLNEKFKEGEISAKSYWEQMSNTKPLDSIASVNAEIAKTNEQLKFNAERLTYINELYANGEINKEMWEKMSDSVNGVNDDIKRLGEGIADSIGQNANNAVNNFIDNIGKAKFSFTDFATSVIKDLAKVMVQMMIMKPLIDSFKSFMGGFGGASYNQNTPGFIGPPQYAKGGSFENGTNLPQGVYDSPTLFKFAKGGTFGRMGMLGEAGAEAIMPLRRNSSGQLGVQAQASPTNIVINNNAQVEVTASESTNQDGSKQIDIMIEKKVKEMFGGGQMDKSMRASYGLTRAAV